MLFNEVHQLNWIHDLYRLAQSDMLQNKTNTLFERILQHIVQGFNANTGSFALCQGKNEPLTIVAGIGLPAECIGSVIAHGSGIIGWVVENGKPLLLEGNIADDPRFYLPARREQSSVPSSALCWPLQSDNRIIGALSINRLDERACYTKTDLESGRMLVNLITLVIDNARLHHEKQQRIEQYTLMNEQLQTTRHHLEQSKKRMDDTLDSLDSVVWSVTPDTFAPCYLNQAAKDVYGYPVADFFNQPSLWLDIIASDDRDKVKNCLAQLRNNIVEKITYRIVHGDKKLCWMSTHMRYIPDTQGRPAHIDGITADFTPYKNATDLLKKKNEEIQAALTKLQGMQQQLTQSEKMASIGLLAAGVAHEINNPIGYINSNLTSLKNYIDNLLALVAIYEKAEATSADTDQLAQINSFKQEIDLEFLRTDVLDLLEESHEGTTRVRKIIQDLKDFSHLSSDDDWQWTNLHAGLESTLNIANNEIKYKAKIVKEFGDLPEVKCVPHQLNQVFMNLLINATHAIESEGTITLRTGTENNQVWVEISDTGKGIAPEHLSKIFDPFFTTKPIGFGTGLGLSVSYTIIKKHQGEIQLTSQLGLGTTFRIVLPINGAVIENT
ncbi:MAG: ATP-binding protein [Methylobacter sp.]|nr:ATP-binding protein [Methylobacter sp.]